MVQRKTFNLYLARTAAMLSGARRVAAVLLMMLLTMTAQTAWAQDPPQYPPLPDPDGDGNVTLEGGNYSVTSDVNISGNITVNNPVQLTISSGATLSVGGRIEGQMGTIEIQGGTFIGQDCSIDVNTLNMNGGSVEVNGLIFRSGNIQNATVEAWSVVLTAMTDNITITGSTIVSNDILADGVTFSGSNVTVNGSLKLSGAVVFDASSPAVSIKVEEYDNDYGGTLTISNGSLTDGENIYTGTIANPSVLNGKTLTYYNASSAITVSLNAQGGSGGTESVTPTAGSDMPAITPPTRTGYTFGGYYTETNGGGTKYYNADGTSAHVCELTGTVTLYAKWTANTYTVTFDRQGGSGGTESVNNATFGSAMPAITPPTRTDCEFFGYYTAENGGGTKYYNADGSSARTWGIGDDATLYAYWKKYLHNDDITIEIPAQTYSGSQLTPVVTVKDNGIEVSDAHYNIILPEGRTNAGDYTINIEAKEGSTAYVMGTQATFTISPKALTVTANPKTITYGDAPANDGVTYSGYVNGEDESVLGGTLVYDYDYTQNDPVGTYDIIPSGLTATNYDITFANGTLTVEKAASSVTAAPTAKSLVYDGSEQTLINAGTASGGTMNYSLDNSTWSTVLPTAIEAGEYTVLYKVEGDGNHNNTEAALIMAYIDYTIDYVLNGGSVASANPTRYNVTTATFTLTNPTRTGYDFAGWTGTGLTDATETVTIAQGSTGNRSYTATWEIACFDVDDITYEWTMSGTDVKIIGYNGTASNLTIPESVDYNGVSYTVTEIGEGAFENNTTLSSMNLDNSVNLITTIGARAFKGCTNLYDFHFPPCLTSIGSEAFSGSGLTEITPIPDGVTSIGAKAFADCTNLTSVTIPASVTSIADDAFENCNANLVIYVPEGLVDSYSNKWSAYTIVPVGAIPYIAADGSKAYRTEGTYTVLTGSTEDVELGSNETTTWYVVKSDVGYYSIELKGDINLILCDGKTMTADGASVSAIRNGSSLTIYGQTAGTGKLIAESGEGYGIKSNAITINGGTVNAIGGYHGNYGAIYASDGNVTINGGNVTAESSDGSDGTVGISAAANIILGGGIVTAKNFSANGNVTIASGLVYTDGTYAYNSATPSATLVALTDVTLIPKKDFTLCTATVPDQLLGSYTKIMYKFEAANSPSNGIIIGESVKDGETTLTLGTDYEFGSVSYQDPDADPSYALNSDDDKPNDECLVEIRGKGDYAGTKTVPFTIISPSGNGTWGDLSWSVENGTLSITGTGAMNAAAKYGGYPWYPYSSIITTVNIGEGVTSVADNAFGAAQNNSIYTYNNVAKVTIPASVTSIGEDAFKGCISTTDVYCYADPTKLTWGDTGDDFKSGKATKCHVADASAWSSFSGVNVTFEGNLAAVSIPYIDADGNTAYCTDFTAINDNNVTSFNAGWYVVNDNIDFDYALTLNGNVNLILADRCTMNANGGIVVSSGNSLTIYAQSDGGSMGVLNAVVLTSDGYSAGIGGSYDQSCGTVTINGGDITASGGYNGAGIGGGSGGSGGTIAINGGSVKAYGNSTSDNLGGGAGIGGGTGGAAGNITINGGTVTARGTWYVPGIGGGINGKGGNITINGGKVTSEGGYNGDNGINGTITLGGGDSNDFICASSYTGTVTIVDGKGYADTNNMKTYLGTLTSAEVTAIANVKIQPITGVTLTKDGSGNLTASLDPTSEEEVSIPVAVEVDHVEVNRTYESGKASTVYLPFSIALGKVSGGTFNKFTGVDETTTPLWTVKYTEVTSGNIEANTPYIFLPAGGKITVNNGDVPITVGTEIASTPQTASGWEFIGTHKRIKWTRDKTDPEYTAEREAEIGSIYGFSAVDSGSEKVGDFVKVGNNVFINPERAYLKRTASSARAMTSGAQTQQLPEKMRVVIVSANGTTTEIGTLDTCTGEISFDEWYSLDGRKLSGKPSKSGMYIKNGKKVIVK
jgi:uncharacterized repeat protein (TIGR02543 family)